MFGLTIFSVGSKKHTKSKIPKCCKQNVTNTIGSTHKEHASVVSNMFCFAQIKRQRCVVLPPESFGGLPEALERHFCSPKGAAVSLDSGGFRTWLSVQTRPFGRREDAMMRLPQVAGGPPRWPKCGKPPLRRSKHLGKPRRALGLELLREDVGGSQDGALQGSLHWRFEATLLLDPASSIRPSLGLVFERRWFALWRPYFEETPISVCFVSLLRRTHWKHCVQASALVQFFGCYTTTLASCFAEKPRASLSKATSLGRSRQACSRCLIP